MITLKAFDPKKGHFIVAGHYCSKTLVFTKRVTKNHYMRCKSGYGIQTSIMLVLFQRGCKTIQILATKYLYKVSLKDWYDREDIEDYGHGQQYFYPVSKMKQVKNER